MEYRRLPDNLVVGYPQVRRYLVRPGWVTSKNDGKRHFICADRLIELYGVDSEECVVETFKGERGHPRDLVVLAPDSRGVYEPPR